MAILKDLSSIIGGYSKFYLLAVGLISATGVWVSLPLEMTSASPQADVGPTIPVAGDVQAGRILFEKHCVTCHGPRGRGDGLAIAGATVADLSSPTTQQKLNADLLATIHEGRPGKVMPSWEYRFSKEQLRDVLAYVRTLKK